MRSRSRWGSSSRKNAASERKFPNIGVIALASCIACTGCQSNPKEPELTCRGAQYSANNVANVDIYVDILPEGILLSKFPLNCKSIIVDFDDASNSKVGYDLIREVRIKGGGARRYKLRLHGKLESRVEYKVKVFSADQVDKVYGFIHISNSGDNSGSR